MEPGDVPTAAPPPTTTGEKGGVFLEDDLDLTDLLPGSTVLQVCGRGPTCRDRALGLCALLHSAPGPEHHADLYGRWCLYTTTLRNPVTGSEVAGFALGNCHVNGLIFSAQVIPRRIRRPTSAGQMIFEEPTGFTKIDPARFLQVIGESIADYLRNRVIEVPPSDQRADWLRRVEAWRSTAATRAIQNTLLDVSLRGDEKELSSMIDPILATRRVDRLKIFEWQETRPDRTAMIDFLIAIPFTDAGGSYSSDFWFRFDLLRNLVDRAEAGTLLGWRRKI